MRSHVRLILVASSGFILLNALALCGAEAKRKSDSAGISFVEPLIGHVYDAGTKKIRTILGIPGAARVADAIPLNTVENGLVGAAGSLAIASVVDQDTAMLVHPLDSSQPVKPISGSMRAFKSGAFSPSGASALLLGTECNCLQIASGFADSPSITRTIDSSALPGDLTAVAINDSASLAAVAVAGLEDASQPAEVVIFDLNSDAPPRVLVTSSASALAFSPSGRDLAVADARTQSLSLVQDVAADAAIVHIAGAAEGLSMPSAVTFVNPNLLLVADRSGLVHVVDLPANQVSSISCSCRPDSAELMALKSTYRLTGTESGAVWILNLTESGPVVRFVPVDSDSSDPTQTEGVQ